MKKQALLIIDHGSRKQAANDMIFEVVESCRKSNPNLIIHGAHMELADPDILEGFKACIADGADYITAIPFMLSPGRHSTTDIPNLCAAASKECKDIPYCVTNHFGNHPLITTILLERGTSCPQNSATECERCRPQS